MKKSLLALSVALGVLLLVGILLFWQRNGDLSPKDVASSLYPSSDDADVLTNDVSSLVRASVTRPSAADVAEEMKWINAPISFWGKVVDEGGKPISGVSVSYTAMDKPLDQLVRDQGTRYTGKSDANGLFSITGIKGMGLGVQVTKEGYYQTRQSTYSIGYAVPNEHKLPSPNEPMIFVLRKMGETEPLKVYSSGGIRVPKDGEPVSVSLARGRVVPVDQGDMEVQVWTQDQQKDSQRRYPWKCRISVPGGGLIERKDQFDFMAPADGYVSAMEISMDQAAERWQKGFSREYFLQLHDGTYARMAMSLTTGGDHFFMIESYHNPKPGSRNLEFDATKEIKSQ